MHIKYVMPSNVKMNNVMVVKHMNENTYTSHEKVK